MTAVDEWDGDEGESVDFTRIPYPEVWNRDPDDADAAGSDVDGEGFAGEVIDAAHAWCRAVELLVEQGFPPEECEAEIMRRCARVPRRQRAMTRRIEQDDVVYGRLDADESVCDFPWGRLCPEHGNTLREARRGTYCAREGCDSRWPVGHTRGHCDLPAVVVIPSSVKKRGAWRLCAGHRRLYPDGPVVAEPESDNT